jgi:hypothetical protein
LLFISIFFWNFYVIFFLSAKSAFFFWFLNVLATFVWVRFLSCYVYVGTLFLVLFLRVVKCRFGKREKKSLHKTCKKVKKLLFFVVMLFLSRIVRGLSQSTFWLGYSYRSEILRGHMNPWEGLAIKFWVGWHLLSYLSGLFSASFLAFSHFEGQPGPPSFDKKCAWMSSIDWYLNWPYCTFISWDKVHKLALCDFDVTGCFSNFSNFHKLFNSIFWGHEKNSRLSLPITWNVLNAFKVVITTGQSSVTSGGASSHILFIIFKCCSSSEAC